MKTLIIALLLLSAHCYAACGPYDILGSWHTAVTITNSTLPTASTLLDTVITIGRGEQLSLVIAGNLTTNTTETFAGGSWDYLSVPPYNYPCDIAVKSWSLLSQNGAASGKRIARYTITVDGVGGTISGTCQIQTYDANGNLLGVTNGTVSGATMNGELSVDVDPYWPFSPFY